MPNDSNLEDDSAARIRSPNRALRRLISCAAVAYFLGVLLIPIIGLLSAAVGPDSAGFFVVLAGLLILGSIALLVLGFIVDDLYKWARQGWRFSLRSLLIATTVLAVMFGAGAFVSRYVLDAYAHPPALGEDG